MSPWTWNGWIQICIWSFTCGLVVGKGWEIMFGELTPSGGVTLGAVLGSTILVVREVVIRGKGARR